MDNLKLNDRLNRIEKLLLGSKKVLTFAEACDYTGISHSYMYKLTSSNRIPFSKPLGKIIFFSKTKLDEWLLSNNYLSEKEIEGTALSYVIKNKR